MRQNCRIQARIVHVFKELSNFPYVVFLQLGKISGKSENQIFSFPKNNGMQFLLHNFLTGLDLFSPLPFISHIETRIVSRRKNGQKEFSLVNKAVGRFFPGKLLALMVNGRNAFAPPFHIAIPTDGAN